MKLFFFFDFLLKLFHPIIIIHMCMRNDEEKWRLPVDIVNDVIDERKGKGRRGFSRWWRIVKSYLLIYTNNNFPSKNTYTCTAISLTFTATQFHWNINRCWMFIWRLKNVQKMCVCVLFFYCDYFISWFDFSNISSQRGEKGIDKVYLLCASLNLFILYFAVFAQVHVGWWFKNVFNLSNWKPREWPCMHFS